MLFSQRPFYSYGHITFALIQKGTIIYLNICLKMCCCSFLSKNDKNANVEALHLHSFALSGQRAKRFVPNPGLLWKGPAVLFIMKFQDMSQWRWEWIKIIQLFIIVIVESKLSCKKFILLFIVFNSHRYVTLLWVISLNQGRSKWGRINTLFAVI